MYPSDQRLSMPRRGLLTLAGAFSLLAVTGCGSDRSSTGSTTTETASAGSFPVVIRHALGSTTIKQAPQRIVTIGQGATEALISMGSTRLALKPMPGELTRMDIYPGTEKPSRRRDGPFQLYSPAVSNSTSRPLRSSSPT